MRHKHAFTISGSMRGALLEWSSFALRVMLDDQTSVSLPKPLHAVVSSTKKQKTCASPCSVRPPEFELAFRRLLLVFVAVVMVMTGQNIIDNKIAHIITQSLASILVEAEMLTG